MKIAIIHSRLDRKGGTQRKVLSCAQALKRLENEVTVYALAYDKEKCYPDLLEGLAVVPLRGYTPAAQRSQKRFLGPINYLLYSRNENRAARALALLIDSETEILNPYDRLSYRVAWFYKKSVRPIPSVAVMDDIYLKLWSYWRKKQFDPSLTLPFKRHLFYWLADRYESARFIRPHEEIVVLDRRTKEWVGRFFKKEARIVRNGLDLEKFPYIPRRARRDGEVFLFSAGIFFLHRRYEDIIRALKIIQEKGYAANLTLAGDYGAPEYLPYQKKIAELAAILGVARSVVFRGKISEDELLDCYRTHDIYVSANHLQSWGLAVFEALSSGMPAIVSETSGASEVLEDGKTVLLVPPASPQAIASSVEKFMKNPGFYEKMSIEGRKFVEENITWEKTGRELMVVFSGVLQKKSWL